MSKKVTRCDFYINCNECKDNYGSGQSCQNDLDRINNLQTENAKLRECLENSKVEIEAFLFDLMIGLYRNPLQVKDSIESNILSKIIEALKELEK